MRPVLYCGRVVCRLKRFEVGRFEETVVVKYVPFLATMQSVLASLGTPATGAVDR